MNTEEARAVTPGIATKGVAKKGVGAKPLPPINPSPVEPATTSPPLSAKSPSKDLSRGKVEITKPPDSPDAPPEETKSGFKKNIMGDVFGSINDSKASMLGMLYRSRIQGGNKSKNKGQSSIDDTDEASVTSQIEESIDLADDIESDQSDLEKDDENNMNPKLRLATTIKNWTLKPENDKMILQEGAVHALVALTSIDDARIKFACATALHNLAAREVNRHDFLSIGGCVGISTICKNIRNWKVAKLCAMSLYYLSQLKGGEGLLSRQGAVLSLAILINARNHRLAPVCVQALYNLTCVEDYLPGLERISKALLSLPTLNFDAIPAIIKAVVNCTRYPPTRNRIIEDGGIQNFIAVVNSLPGRVNKDELAFHVSLCLRQLSDTPGCRSDMISKGAIELMHQMLGFINEECRRHVVKTLHNLISAMQSFPSTMFEVAVNIVTELIAHSSDQCVLQIASACIWNFSQDNMRHMAHLAQRVSKSLTKLLLSSDGLTQFFAVSTASRLFFSRLLTDENNLEGLVRKFVYCGTILEEQITIQGLAISLALMSQEEAFICIFEKFNLLENILDLMIDYIARFPDVEAIQMSFCISTCRLLLRIKSVPAKKREDLSDVLKTLLGGESAEVLAHTISGIQALLEHGICHQELLSDELIIRIGSIADRFLDDPVICRTCSAVLAVLSFDSNSHRGLSTDELLKTIFQLSKSDDMTTRLLVTTAICNISSDIDARKQLIVNGVLDIIATLSGTTSERIQELCARCTCNLSCAVELHPQMIKERILQILLMISLVRSVANATKQLCARALLNMCTDENLRDVLDAGVCRAFSTLSFLADPITQNICARGFFWLSSYEIGRLDMIQRRVNLHALFTLVKCVAPRTRSAVGKAVFNLFACPESRLAMISASGLSVLKILATMDYEDIRECVARVITGLCQDTKVHPMLVRESMVPVLVLLAKNSYMAFDFTVNAISCMAQHRAFHGDLVQRGIVSSLVNALVCGKVETKAIADEVCRTFCFLSFTAGHATAMVKNEHLLIGLHVLKARMLCSKQATDEVLAVLCNLSYTRAVRKYLINQDCFKMLKKIMEASTSHHRIRSSFASHFIHNLCLDSTLHDDLLEQGVMSTLMIITQAICNKSKSNRGQMSRLASVVEHDSSIDHESAALLMGSRSFGDLAELSDDEFDLPDDDIYDYTKWSEKYHVHQKTLYNITMSIQLLSKSSECRPAVVEGKAVQIMQTIMTGHVNDNAMHEISCAIHELAQGKECREQLVLDGAIDLIKALAESPYKETQTECFNALGALSEATMVGSGTVEALIDLSLKDENGLVGEDDDASITSTDTGTLKKETAKDRERLRMEASYAADGQDHQTPQLFKDKMRQKSEVLSQANFERLREINGETNAKLFAAYLKKRDLEIKDPIAIPGETVDLEMNSEIKALLFSKKYKGYDYAITQAKIGTDAGGISKKVPIELPFPGMSGNTTATPNRTDELVEVPIHQEFLPKYTELIEISDKDEDHMGSKLPSNTKVSHKSSTQKSNSVDKKRVPFSSGASTPNKGTRNKT